MLVNRVAAGNRLAIARLASRGITRVYRFILRWVGDASIAEDATSEVFLSLWRQADQFKAQSSVSTWLLAIARHKAVAELRRRRGQIALGERSLELQIRRTIRRLPCRRRTQPGLRLCLTRLSPEHREMIDLVYYHEKSIEEIAEIVGIPKSTVKTRARYARKKLGNLLDTVGFAA